MGCLLGGSSQSVCHSVCVRVSLWCHFLYWVLRKCRFLSVQDNVQQVEQLINQQIQESDSSNGITKGLVNGPAAVWA